MELENEKPSICVGDISHQLRHELEFVVSWRMSE
jgi:hypothetical protein